MTGAGCSASDTTSAFECLVTKDSLTLQKSSYAVSGTGAFGEYVFVPVVDDIFIQQQPTRQLQHGQTNGFKVLVGQNANEGIAAYTVKLLNNPC